MDGSAIVQAISTVGFPIVMCLILLYYMHKNDERYDTQIQKLTESVNNNTQAITQLVQKLEDISDCIHKSAS